METRLLRPAKTLREENNSRTMASNKRSFVRELNSVVGKIEEAHASERKDVTVLSLSDDISKMLKVSGYKVTFQRACGCGDMDSYLIDWS